ncbi:MAG: hypothetical protein AAF628_03390 [Planctomycetota bacterium]
MNEPSSLHRRLAEEALQKSGWVRLTTVLQLLVPKQALRALAHRFGQSPKGFRLERASAKAIADLLAGATDADELAEICATLESSPDLERPAPDSQPAAANDEPARERLHAHYERELERLREELDRARQSATRQRAREAALEHDLLEQREAAARLRAEIRQRRQETTPESSDGALPPEVTQRLHVLERDLATLAEIEEGLRHRLAAQTGEARRLEQEVEELTALVPRGRKRKTPPPPAPPVPDLFRVPRFAPSFYKSLEAKTRRAASQTIGAALLFCTEGPSYPGLEVKRLEGSVIWSLRAALKLRVYFLLHDDGTAEFVEVVDREEQHTALRRLKER